MPAQRPLMRVCIVVVVVALLCARTAEAAFGDFSIGRGKFDVTGPVTQVGFMGYAMLQQTGRGLHFRQFARAFVVRDLHAVGRPLSVYVSIDIGMVFQGLHDEVVRQLATRAPGVFSEASLLLSGTHTHSGPGGFGMHPLYDVTTEGFSPLCFGAIANGTVEAILQAHSSMSTGGRILINQGELLGANANRGAFAYLQNPPEERARFAYDVDKTMVVLRFQDESGAELGAVALFATHGTSMFNNNRLVSGDNKGYASYLFERHMNGWSARAASGPFVAAFGQSNEGDVTPNVRGAFCLFPASVKGQPCDFDHSTCGGRNEGCQGQGPHGLADFENTAAIGELQFHKALELWSNATTTLTPGYMKFAKMYVDMSNVTVRPPFAPSVVSTCPASLGDGFAAGTTDGPGAFDFVQGTNKTSTNPFWNWIRFLRFVHVIRRLLTLLQSCCARRPSGMGSAVPVPQTHPSVYTGHHVAHAGLDVQRVAAADHAVGPTGAHRGSWRVHHHERPPPTRHGAASIRGRGQDAPWHDICHCRAVELLFPL